MLKGKRLDRLEERLSPRQAALLWLHDANKSVSFKEYFKSLLDQYEVVRPFYSLSVSVEQAVLRNRKGEPKAAINGAASRAKCDFAFLVKLHHQINIDLMLKDLAWIIMVKALTEGLLKIGWQVRFTDLVATAPMPGMCCMPKVGEDVRGWRDGASTFLRTMYTPQQAAASVSQSYFSGEDVLFPDFKHSLEGRIEQGEQLVKTFNEVAAGEVENIIDLATLRERDDKAVAQLIQDWGRSARADALDAMGDNEGAIELMERNWLKR